MKKFMKLAVVGMCLSLAITGLVANGQGEEEVAEDFAYPTKAITITCPYPAGGAADVICRQISTLGSEKGIFDKPVVVVNRTGAGGVIATTEFVSSKADSHKINLFSRAIFVTIPLKQQVKYSYAEDIEPVVGIENVDFILYASSKRDDINTLEKLMAYADKNVVTYGTAGAGTDIDLIQSGMLKDAAVKAKPVVFGGAKVAVNNVLAGNVDIAAAPPAAAKDFVENGQLVPLGIFSAKPYEGFEGITVPTMKEQGVDIVYPGLNFFGVAKGTDPRVIEYLNAKINEVYALPEFVDFVEKSGIDLLPLAPEEIDNYIAEQQQVADRLR